MEAVRLNINGNRQNIEIPETMNFTDHDLCATKIGEAIIIMPRRSVRDLMRQGFSSFTADIFEEGRAPLSSKPAPNMN